MDAEIVLGVLGVQNNTDFDWSRWRENGSLKHYHHIITFALIIIIGVNNLLRGSE